MNEIKIKAYATAKPIIKAKKKGISTLKKMQTTIPAIRAAVYRTNGKLEKSVFKCLWALGYVATKLLKLLVNFTAY